MKKCYPMIEVTVSYKKKKCYLMCDIKAFINVNC